MTTPVTPRAGINTVVATGGTSVIAVPANPNGGVIVNPLLASDQGLVTAEVLYVNPTGLASLFGNATTFALQPGQVWSIIPGQTTATWVNAPSSSHAFSVIYY